MRICSGRFSPVPPGRYSPELTSFCHSLLSLDPKKRPTTEQILSSVAASKWMHVLPTPPPVRRYSENGAAAGPAPGNGRLAAALMDTIMVPRDLRQLPKVLPPPSYDSDAMAKPAPAPHMAPIAAAKPPLPSHARAASAGRMRADAGVGAPPAQPPALKPVPTGLQLPPILQRQNSAGALQAPALRPAARRISYS